MTETPAADLPATTSRFAILGTGRIARRMAAELQSAEGVAVTAIASREQSRADWFAAQYGIPAAAADYTELLGRDDVDAVYLAVPPALHARWAVAAAEAGKHVLCEKPLAISLQQALEIDAACHRSGVRWLDATAWLHHERTATMLGLLREGSLGQLRHVSVSVSFARPFISGDHRLETTLGGGCLLDLGWYAAGLACRVADAAPSRAFCDVIDEGDVPMRMTGMLWFDDGSRATLSCGYDTATRKWFEAAGSKASVICDDFTRPWADRKTRFWMHDASGAVSSYERNDRQEQRLIAVFLGQRPLVPWQIQALRTQAVLDALADSALAGVPVPVSSLPCHRGV